MRDADYTEWQRQSVEGRWTLWRIRERSGAQRFGRWWLVDPQVTPKDTPELLSELMPVVPCDDAAVERAVNKVQEQHNLSTGWEDDVRGLDDDEVRELVLTVLRAAGEGGSVDA